MTKRQQLRAGWGNILASFGTFSEEGLYTHRQLLRCRLGIGGGRKRLQKLVLQSQDEIGGFGIGMPESKIFEFSKRSYDVTEQLIGPRIKNLFPFTIWFVGQFESDQSVYPDVEVAKFDRGRVGTRHSRILLSALSNNVYDNKEPPKQ